ncbi:MAG: hypothetical protein NTV15_07770 [Candidatus Bathyarchaeota archaeon]|nr:hypothetical protein [Candidatus Bathyarchaeota archaeon]
MITGLFHASLDTVNLRGGYGARFVDKLINRCTSVVEIFLDLSDTYPNIVIMLLL